MFQILLGIVYVSLLVTSIVQALRAGKSFFFYFILLMFVSPTAQYLVYNGTGENYFTTNFQRLSLEFINICLLVVYAIQSKFHLSFSSSYLKLYYYLLLLWNLFHVGNIILSLDVKRSLIFYIISVLGPSLFSLVVIHKSAFFSKEKIIKLVYRTVSVFLVLGIISLLYQVLKMGAYVPILMRTAGGMYLSNFSVCLLALFIPIIFKNASTDSLELKLLKVVLNIGILILLLVSLSRAGIITYLFYYLFISITSPRKILVASLLAVVIFISINNQLKKISGLSLVDAIEHRFLGYEKNLSSNSKEDERLKLYKSIYRIFESKKELIFFGVGIGNYRLIKENPKLYELANKGSLNYSNAHSLFVNNLIERGVFILLLLLSILSTFLVIARRLIRKLKPNPKEQGFYIGLYHGVLLFLFIAFFNMDLFVSAAYQSGLAGYMLFFSISLVLAKYKELPQYSMAIKTQ